MTEAAEKPEPFDVADYYDCRESEELTSETVEEELEQFIDRNLSPECDVTEEIRKICPIEVVALSRKEITEHFVRRVAEECYARLAELFHEEYGEIEGDYVDFDKESAEQVMRDFVPVVRKAAARGHVWQCEQVGKREYDFEEVLRLMREHCPEWFE
jgi:hypothetical protein